MKHPTESELALYAGGDLGVLARWRMAGHVAACPACARAVASFSEIARGLRRDAGTVPEGLHWGSLAAEMRANIRLGVDAGAVVAAPVPAREPIGWKAAVVFAALTAVIVSGWWLYLPRLQPKAPETGVTVAAQGDGVELREGAGMLLLMHPKPAGPGDVLYSVDAEGGARARFVDEQSGQVTINNVYAE